MLIKLVNGVFLAESTFEERHAVKEAGFWWHGGGCRPGCKACGAGLGLKVWWTFKPECASRLLAYCTDEAKAALSGHVQKVEASKAVDADIEIPVPEGLNYLPYQRAGIAYASQRKSTLIGDEMGLGKTIQALGTVNACPDIKTVLVVCPKSLRLNWVREAKKWLVRDFNYHMVEAGDETVPADAAFVVVNYNLLKGTIYDALMARNWDLLVADEAHYAKNPKAQRSQALLGVPEKKSKK